MKTTCPLSALLPALGLLLGLISFNAQAIDSRMENACYHAFAGKCFHAGDVPIDLSQIILPADAAAYCASSTNYCSPEECTGRVEVLPGSSWVAARETRAPLSRHYPPGSRRR